MIIRQFKALASAFIIGALLAFLVMMPVFYRLGTRISQLLPENDPDTTVNAHYDTITHVSPTPSSTATAGAVLIPVSQHHPSPSVLNPLPDTITLHDTLYVQLPIQRKTYQDSTYKAVVSGYRPSLDSIEVYRRTEIRTVSQPMPYNQYSRWGAGPFIGVGWTGKAIVPVVGLSVHYDLLRIRSSISVTKD